jgi:hypothetical protein
VPKNQLLLSRVAAIMLLSLGLVSFVYILFFDGIDLLLSMDVGFSLPLLSLGTMTLLLLVLSMLLRYFKCVPVSLTLYALSLPLGCIWSVTQYINTLYNYSDDIKAIAIQLMYMVLPVLYAGVLCTVGYFFEFQSTAGQLKTLRHKGNGYIAIVCMVGVLTYPIYTLSWSSFHLESIMFILSVGAILVGITLLISGVKGIQCNKMKGLVKEVGLISVLFGAAFVATFYATFTHLDKPKALGPLILQGLFIILFGLMTYSVGLTLALNKDKETVAWISRANWHITEAYAFVLFVTLSAKSIFSMYSE